MISGLAAAESNTDITMVNGILGEPVTFPLNIQGSQEIDNIAWMSSKTTFALVQPGDSGRAPHVILTHENYNGRINVSHQNYNLEISNLRMEDEGIYKANINTKVSGKVLTTTRSYNLQVYCKLWEDRGLDFLFLLCKFAIKEHLYFWQLDTLNLFIFINTDVTILILIKRMWLCF